ncbi:MAG: HD domain-containing protein, partial [bacterium]
VGMDVVDEAKSFLISYLRGKENAEDRAYPWKESWEYVVHHSFRTESYAEEIIVSTAGISEKDALLIRTAAVLHDIGSLDDRKNHAKAGAAIVRTWTTNKKSFSEHFDTKELSKLIAGHQKKDPKEKDIRMAVLCDADLLDGVGAMSIFMMAHKASPSSHDYPRQVMEIMNSEGLDYLKKKRGKLATEAGKELFDRKAEFVETFYRELKDELKGTENLPL